MSMPEHTLVQNVFYNEDMQVLTWDDDHKGAQQFTGASATVQAMEKALNEVPSVMNVRVRPAKPTRRGILLATKLDDETYGVSFSACSSQDTFKRKRGLHIALVRAMRGHTSAEIPFYLMEKLPRFLFRCDAYFKGCKARVAESHTE